MHNTGGALALVAVLAASGSAMAQSADPGAKPTIVLVHGAFAESSSWNDVIAELGRDGYRAIDAANPLRGVASDAVSVAAVVKSIPGEVVLVAIPTAGRSSPRRPTASRTSRRWSTSRDSLPAPASRA